MADEIYTVAFRGHPKNIKGSVFEYATDFGEVVTIGVGNVFEKADRFEEALEEIAEGFGKEAKIAQQALDDANAAVMAALAKRKAGA